MFQAILIGKGPSAVYAQQYVTDADVVATLNEACLSVLHVDYGFFVDVERLEGARAGWDRIRRFVLPEFLHVREEYSGLGPQDVLGLPLERTTTYIYELIPTNPVILCHAVSHNKILLCYTATAAMHWLAMHGCISLLCIGNENVDGSVDAVYVRVKHLMRCVAALLDEYYGMQTVFWEPPSHGYS